MFSSAHAASTVTHFQISLHVCTSLFSSLPHLHHECTASSLSCNLCAYITGSGQRILSESWPDLCFTAFHYSTEAWGRLTTADTEQDETGITFKAQTYCSDLQDLLSICSSLFHTNVFMSCLKISKKVCLNMFTYSHATFQCSLRSLCWLNCSVRSFSSFHSCRPHALMSKLVFHFFFALCSFLMLSAHVQSSLSSLSVPCFCLCTLVEKERWW